MCGSRHREAGFTLMEVLVAFAILSISLAAILQIFSGGLRNAAVADRALVALGHAESLLASAGIERPLAEGERTGQLSDGMTWRESIARYSDAETLATPPPPAMQPYSVTVTVTWEDGFSRRDVTLTTLRLGGET